MNSLNSTTITILKNNEDKETPTETNKEKDTKICFQQMKLKPIKKVKWTEDTIDNEHLGKKKSKSKQFVLYKYSLLYFQKTYFKSR